MNLHNFSELGCEAKIPEGNCKLIGSECWCYKDKSGAASDVCGYPQGYRGPYYSLATNSSNSPWTIIRGLGKEPGTSCKKDTASDCQGNESRNVCQPDKTCTGTSLKSQTDLYRWMDEYPRAIVRCVNMEGRWII